MRLAKLVKTALDELACLCSGPRSCWDSSLTSLGCITLAVIFPMAPAAYHRIVFSGQDTEEVHRIGSWFITGATVPLALGLAGDIYVVFAAITASSLIALLVAGITLVFLVGFWHAFPVITRLRRLRRSRRGARCSLHC
jgi:hypothetical protein